jgi:hypothetical protein
MRKSKKSIFAKVTIFMALAFVVGVGLCGLDYVLGANGIGKSGGEFSVGPLDGLSLVVMIFSAIGLGLTLFVWFIVTVVSSFGKKASEPQQLFDEKDETKPGDPQ